MNIHTSLIRIALPLLLATTAARAADITLYSSYNIEVGSTRQLTAYVPLSPNTVTFTVNGIAGGNAMVGTISPTGLYSAPATVPMPNAVKVRATSTAYPDKFGEATMTVTQVGIHLWSSAPTSVSPGAFSLRLNGSNFVPGVIVKFGDVELASTVSSSTSLTATGTATAAQVGTRVPLTVRQVGNGATTSETVMVSVVAGTNPPPTTPAPPTTPSPSIAVAPSTATLAPSASPTPGTLIIGPVMPATPLRLRLRSTR